MGSGGNHRTLITFLSAVSRLEKFMKEAEVRERAFAMPLTSPAYPRGPYRFYHREYFIIAYRTASDKLRALVPEPLEVDEPVVNTSSFACRIRPASATIPKPVR